MTKYVIVRRSDRATATVDAARYEHDGSGDRFYDADDNVIVSFADGILESVTPESVVFSVPTPAPTEPEGGSTD